MVDAGGGPARLCRPCWAGESVPWVASQALIGQSGLVGVGAGLPDRAGAAASISELSTAARNCFLQGSDECNHWFTVRTHLWVYYSSWTQSMA